MIFWGKKECAKEIYLWHKAEENWLYQRESEDWLESVNLPWGTDL